MDVRAHLLRHIFSINNTHNDGLYACVAEERGDVRFAGCLRKGAIDEKVLIRLQVDEDTGSGSIQLRCDDPIVAASLIDVLKKAVST